MKNCPSTAQLNELILGTLAQETADELTEHVGSCDLCQASMQSIAEGEIPVDSLVTESLSAAPPANSAFWNVQEMSLSKTLSQTDRNIGSTQDTNLRESALVAAGSQDENEKPTKDDFLFLEPSDVPDSVGKLQQFEVKRIIGRGGMGVVLEGFDTELHRSVAIKVLNPKFQQDEIARERFCREGRAAASVSHEHVVQMFQVARADETKLAYLVMQLIEGQTLEDRLKESKPLPPEDVARIGMQMAAGLSAAHTSGLVHRDIKPGNVLIEESTDRVKLTDFGLARVDDEVKLTQTGMLTGTVLYMSPEQALGQQLDMRSDLFSLGAVMYEMATGQSPFEAPTAVGVMKRIMDENPPKPNKLNPAIGKPTSDLIMQLLAKRPDKRPDSADLVARALASVVTEFGPISPLQVPAVPSSEVKKLSASYSVASRRWSIGGWAIAGILLLALAIPFLSKWSAWYDVTGRFPSVVLSGNPGTVWAADFTDDGKSLAAGIGDGSVRLWDVEKQEVIKSFNAHEGNVWNIEFHPTQNLVATAGDDSLVKVWDSETFEPRFEWKASNSVRGLAFSPDGSRLVAGDRAGKIHVYDIATGKETKNFSHAGSNLGLDFSHDGEFLAAVGSDKIVRIFDAETFDQRQTLTGHKGPIYSVAFAGDSSLLASVGWSNEILVWNAETGELVQTFEGGDGDNWGVAFCDRKNHLMTGGQNGAARLWDLNDGVEIATLQGHSAPVHDIAIDPVNYRIATCSRDGSIRIWDMSSLSDKPR